MIVASLMLAAVVAAVTVVSKEVPRFYDGQPWHDDPYDVPVSLDFVVLPLLVGVGLLRVQLCRRCQPLPVRRVVDLLRLASAVLAVCLVTEAAEWVAVALDRHRATWAVVTSGQVVVLAVLTAATIAARVLVRRADRAMGGLAHPAGQPDWLADALLVALRATRLLGRYQGWPLRGVRWTNSQVIARVRAHPVAAAGLLAGVLAAPFVTAKIVLEGYPAPLVLLITVFITGALFAVIVVAGAYLRVVAPRQTSPPTWLRPVVAACTAGTVGFAFHDSLLTDQTVTQLSALYFGAALATGTFGVALQILWRRRTRRTPH